MKEEDREKRNEVSEEEWHKWSKGTKVIILYKGEVFSNINIPIEHLEEYLVVHGFVREY